MPINNSMMAWVRCITLVVLSCGTSALGAAPVAAPAPAPAPEVVQETLGNGLRVVYVPRPQWPVVHVRVVYHVGSSDERADRQGFAHLFEHLMFRGSAHVGAQEHVRLVTLAGGTCNGQTDYDKTSYFETLPANQLELGLWLEADRMASFEVTEEALAAERRVVAREWAARANRPYATLVDDAVGAVFASGPYAWSPIGEMDHLAEARMEELREFRDAWYVPNNAVLVIAGDFEVAQTQAMVRRLFAWIAPGRDVVRRAASTRSATASAGTIESARAVPEAAQVIALPVGAFDGVDQPALRVLRRILVARLNYFLIDSARPLASAVEVELLRLEKGGALLVPAVLARGQKFDELSQAIFAQAKVIYNEVIQKEIRAAAGAERLATHVARESAGGVAEQIASSVIMSASPSKEDEELAAMEQLKIDQIGKLALKYVNRDSAVTLRVIPSEKLGADAGVAAKAKEVRESPVAKSTRPTTRRAAVMFPESYPKHAPIADGAVVSAAAERIVSERNGAKVVILPAAKTQAMHWALLLRHGPGDVAAGKEGIAQLTASVLDARVRRDVFDPRPRARDLELRGASITREVIDRWTVIRASALVEQLPDALAMTRRLVREPDFQQRDFDDYLLRGPKLFFSAMADYARVEPTMMARRAMTSSLLPGATAEATRETIMPLTLADVRAFHRQAYRPGGATLIISGVTPKQGEAMAAYLLDDWRAESSAAPVEPAVEMRTPRQLEIVLVDRPHGVQCTVRMVAPAFAASSPERPAGMVAAHVLAEGVHSRLGRFVRAENGYAYEVNARFVCGDTGGYFAAACDTGTETAPAAISAVLSVLREMSENDVNDAELNDAKRSLAARQVVRDESALNRLLRAIDREVAPAGGTNDRDRREMDDPHDYHSAIESATAADVRRVMQTYVRPERMTVIVVGPAELLAEPLRQIAPVRVVSMAESGK